MNMLVTALLLPLVGGALLPLFHFKKKLARCLYVEAVVCATSVLVGILIFNRPEGNVAVLSLTDHMVLTFHVDGLSTVFLGLIAFLWPLASLYAFEYMEHEGRENQFFCFYTLSYGVTMGVAMAANLFTLYAFFECLTLITLPLVVHKLDAKSIRAGRAYLYYSITGAAMAFLCLIFINAYGTTTDFQLGGVLDPAKLPGHENLLLAVFVMAFIGFGTKAAVLPMSNWLPTASVAPTPVTALLHAVAVVNAGAFAVLRVTYYSFGTGFLYGTWAQSVVLVLAMATILFGSGMAVKEQHFKRRLAYSTISNLSYILMGAALMTPEGMVGSMTHLIFHGTMKIVLFYCAGAVLIKSGKEYVQDLRGFSKIMPFTCAIFTVAALGLTGIPPMAGFISKLNLMTAGANSGLPLGVAAIFVLVISTVLTAIYLLKIVVSMYFLPVNQENSKMVGKGLDPTLQMKLPLLVLAVLIVAFGLLAQPITDWLTAVATGLY